MQWQWQRQLQGQAVDDVLLAFVCAEVGAAAHSLARLEMLAGRATQAPQPELS